MASMIVGFLSIPIFKFVLPAIEGIGIYFDRAAELGPSFLMGLLAGYLVSIWKPDKNLEEHFLALVEETEGSSGK